MSKAPQPIGHQVFDAQHLVSAFPPKLSDRNKIHLHGLTCPPGSTHRGRLVVTRWEEIPLPREYRSNRHASVFEAREDVFGYEPTPFGAGTVEWYLNFAHRDLFCAYGSPLFAQDEMQVAEHPVLGSLREALLQSAAVGTLTAEEGRPTPILIRGVERRCAVATDRNEREGRPFGLYGNHFAIAKPESVERATRVIDPPTFTNLIAIEAPSHGSGVYSRSDIELVLRTAFTAFRAAMLESQEEATEVGGLPPAVVIHTGFWGCGAYGGNRILMALLQLLAARVAGVDRVVFHTVHGDGSETFTRAVRTLEAVAPSGEATFSLPVVVARVQELGLRWGTGDGN